MQEKTYAIIQLNLGMLLMSVAALFAKLIPWHSISIIAARMLLAAPVLLIFLLIKKKSLYLSSIRDFLQCAFLGFLLTTHWITFFLSIQVSTVAIAIIAVFTCPIFSTFLEPLFRKEKLLYRDIIIAFIAFIGVFVLIDDFSLQSGVAQGVIFGVLAAVLKSLRMIFSKPLVEEYGGSLIMFYQLVVGAIILIPTFFFIPVELNLEILSNLIVLAVVATAAAHTLFLASLSKLSARAAGISSMVLPVYGIVLAFLVLGEVPTSRSVIGGLIIVSAVLFENISLKNQV